MRQSSIERLVDTTGPTVASAAQMARSTRRQAALSETRHLGEVVCHDLRLLGLSWKAVNAARDRHDRCI
jgi:hypothetical protein